MTFRTSLALRWQRAQQIDPARIEPLGHGWYVVPSSREPTGYVVEVRFDPVGAAVAGRRLSVAKIVTPSFSSRPRSRAPAARTVARKTPRARCRARCRPSWAALLPGFAA